MHSIDSPRHASLDFEYFYTILERERVEKHTWHKTDNMSSMRHFRNNMTFLSCFVLNKKLSLEKSQGLGSILTSSATVEQLPDV
jgi:hypothetical protein